ncbi:hypothetical protein POM88_034303 [Heracleum sosnowskyi]|uniref:Uncharacterized protein n=1 Tax=Heracleum sosnowskyi TaxID=360622 RepID=A0AAD8HJ93_9APIA|nr:hypothetical protein POM88_034303 [Heracleum sosnowskyi]
MSSRKKLQFGNTTASPTKEGTNLPAATEEEETDDSGKKIGLSEYLQRFEVGGGDKESENDAEKHSEIEDEQSRKTTGEGQGCNKYEMNRNKRVAEIEKKVAELGLKKMAADLCQNNKGKAKQTKDQGEGDYSPDNEVEPGSDEDETVISKKNKKVKKVVAGAGPRTRSQASKVADSCDKQAHAGSFAVEENDASTVPLGEKLKNIKSKAPGSMAAYLELRELQKTQSEIELSQSQSQAEHLQSQSEADNFFDFLRFLQNEERLEHRPRNIPLQDFKILLKYWGDEDVQAIAKRNTEARSQVTDTHTAGPVSFAQICNKLVLERPHVDVDADQDQDQDQDPDQDPKEAQPPRPLSEADIFIATRKRDEKRTYKLPTDAVQKKIVSI